MRVSLYDIHDNKGQDTIVLPGSGTSLRISRTMTESSFALGAA